MVDRSSAVMMVGRMMTMMTMIIEQMTRLRLLPSQNSLQNVSLRYHLLCAGAGLTEKATKALVHIPTAGLRYKRVQ